MNPASGSRAREAIEATAGPLTTRALRYGRLAGALLALGALSVVLAVALAPGEAGAAASQDWSPFVLVAGLLMVGKVAADDGVFDAAGSRLEAAAVGNVSMYAWSMAAVAVVTAVLNLDTAVTFMTPVTLAAAARRRNREVPDADGRRQGPGTALLYGCLLVSNAASLLLPGSNLTNLIVVGRLHLPGGSFAARTVAPWALAVAVTAAVVALVHRRGLRRRVGERRRPVPAGPRPVHPRPGATGAAAVTAVSVLVLVLSSPAIPVLAVGLGALALEGARRRRPSVVEPDSTGSRRARPWTQVVRDLAAPVLVGLFGVAVGAGALGRAWDGPTRLLAHLDGWGAAAFSAALSVTVNNLPAASLLAARSLSHPFSVLVGLNLGPNLAVSGSLSSVLWWQAARRSGWTPKLGEVTRLGVLSAPLSVAVAEAALMAVGRR